MKNRYKTSFDNYRASGWISVKISDQVDSLDRIALDAIRSHFINIWQTLPHPKNISALAAAMGEPRGRVTRLIDKIPGLSDDLNLRRTQKTA